MEFHLVNDGSKLHLTLRVLGHIFSLDCGIWDYLLLATVSLMSLALAYVPAPRVKAFLLMLPIPFTLATLMVGKGVRVSTIFGVFTLILFTTAVRLLYTRAGWPIVRSIAVSLVGYCIIGVLIARYVPESDGLFWTSLVLMVLTGFVGGWLMPHREEPHHRTPLPIWKKAPVVVGVVILLIAAKKMLEGFTQTFPMVGLIGNYEARHSLWTINRALVRMMCAFAPMFMSIRVLTPKWGIGAALAVGWAGYLAALGVVLLLDRRDALRLGKKPDAAEAETGQTLGA